MTFTNHPTFTLRPPTLDDIPAVVAMLNACWLDTLGTPAFSAEVMHAQWTRPGVDPNTDVRLAVDATGIVGYCAVHCSPPYVSNALLPRTHPAHRGCGIGTALTQWGERRVTEYLALAPATARVTVECSNVATHAAGAHLLCDLGYQHVRSGYEMKIAMSSPPPPSMWPDGITIRSMIADQEEAAVFRALEECGQDHWGHVEKPFDESFAQWLHFIRNVPDYDPAFVFLAMAGDEIAGAALCFSKDNEYPEMAWIQSLGVRRPWRRQGLALALLHYVFGEAYHRGITKVGLGVDTESLTGATRLYEKAGMQIYRQWDTYEKELRPGEDLVTRQVVAG